MDNYFENIKLISGLTYLINPSFSKVTDKLDHLGGNVERIFFDRYFNDGEILSTTEEMFSDVDLEAGEYVELDIKVKKREKKAAINIGKDIARNILKKLKDKYPDREFSVYAELKFGENMRFRFHQTWKGQADWWIQPDCYDPLKQTECIILKYKA